MTPQERQLVADLFERLASLEGGRRDREAEGAIAEGLARAPNAVYALVQTVLVQDEALKRADARIQELESAGGETPRAGGGFLDNMRESLRGRDGAARGSVPTINAASKWNSGQTTTMSSQPYGSAPAEPAGRGGSFLGTAAAAAAGVIGGSLLFSGIQSLMGDHHGGALASAFDSPPGERASPWGGDAANSELARDAGLNDIGSGAPEGRNGGRSAGLFDSSNAGEDDDDFTDDDAGFGDDDSADA